MKRVFRIFRWPAFSAVHVYIDSHGRLADTGDSGHGLQLPGHVVPDIFQAARDPFLRGGEGDCAAAGFHREGARKRRRSPAIIRAGFRRRPCRPGEGAQWILQRAFGGLDGHFEYVEDSRPGGQGSVCLLSQSRGSRQLFRAGCSRPRFLQRQAPPPES